MHSQYLRPSLVASCINMSTLYSGVCVCVCVHWEKGMLTPSVLPDITLTVHTLKLFCCYVYKLAQVRKCLVELKNQH